MRKKEEILKWFKEEARTLMDEVELRPYHLTSLCHMTYNSVQNCLGGHSFPNLWSLVLMAEHLECTVNDLLGYDEVDDASVLEKYRASTMFNNKAEFSHCVADRFTRYLNEHGVSFEELAARAGFNVNTINRWVGYRPSLPTTYHFLQICDALNCTPSELLGY